MKDEKQYLTKEKFSELSKELENLKTVRRKEVAEDLEYAKSLGDLSENAEYHEARDLQANIEDRISKLEQLLKSATVVSTGQSSEMVGVGSIVTVAKNSDSEKKTYTIVGSEEADINQNKVSVSSPIGEAMQGKKKGDEFTFRTPQGSATYKIVDIK